MQHTLSLGSHGEEVKNMQMRLNQWPSQLPWLLRDGIFGPKTQARVLEFQKQNGLISDGIVGPKTRAALDPPGPFRESAVCGNGDPGNFGRLKSIRQQFIDALTGAQSGARSFALVSFSSPGSRFGYSGAPAAGFPSLGSLNPLAGFKPFAGSPADTPNIRRRYGSSINFSTVYISEKTGFQNRPFTVGFSLLPLTPSVVQVMNLGKSPSEMAVIHEMAHVWQSQHHSDPAAFMTSCALAQAAALALNASAAHDDPTLVFRTADGFPSKFPFSAYAYRKGNPFGSYGGEQIAQQVQNNELPIVSKVQSIAAGAVDGDNVKSLGNVNATEDRRLSGVFM